MEMLDILWLLSRLCASGSSCRLLIIYGEGVYSFLLIYGVLLDELDCIHTHTHLLPPPWFSR